MWLQVTLERLCQNCLCQWMVIKIMELFGFVQQIIAVIKVLKLK